VEVRSAKLTAVLRDRFAMNCVTTFNNIVQQFVRSTTVNRNGVVNVGTKNLRNLQKTLATQITTQNPLEQLQQLQKESEKLKQDLEKEQQQHKDLQQHHQQQQTQQQQQQKENRQFLRCFAF